MNYLEQLPRTAKCDQIIKTHEELKSWVNQPKKGFLRYRTPFEILQRFPAETIDLTRETVMIGSAAERSTQEISEIHSQLRAFMPWRKGPFSIYGIHVDSEWQSQRKWQRLTGHLPDMKGKIIADIGCSNGYYMFRMQEYQPKMVVGFEPSVQHYYCFKGLNAMASQNNLHIDLMGIEHLQMFPECFDVIFCMGIIYHRISPVEALRDIYTALGPEGTIILESQAIPGDSEHALFPARTYAKVPGTYFVPTGSCLVNWMTRAGFTEIDLFCRHPMSSAEQRRTAWMTFESYSDFLDPNDPGKTVEGYPAPERIFIRGRKK